MQITSTPTRDRGLVTYRERLGPSLWLVGSAAVLAPMAGLVLVPLDSTIALAAGLLIGVTAVVALVALSPVITLVDGQLRAGRARIDVRFLGHPTALLGEEARRARGPELDPRAWHLIRGGIDGVLVVPIEDPHDPAPAWIISSRTPDRLAAAILRSKPASAAPGSDGGA